MNTLNIIIFGFTPLQHFVRFFLGRQEKFTALQLATVTTNTNVVSNNFTTATYGGEETTLGVGAMSARGVCWSTSPNPTVSL